MSVNKLVKIPLNLISFNEYQPRENFEEEKIEELARSIKEKGLLQPIIVRKKNKGYELIAGERRLKAVKSLNLNCIDCIVREVDSLSSAEIALIENIQREDLNIIEEARAYKRLIQDFKMTQEDLAKKLGLSRSHISNTMRLLKLDPLIQEALLEKKISVGHGKLLISLDRKKQNLIYNKIIEQSLTVRETERLIKNSKGIKPAKKAKKLQDPYIRSLEESLINSLGTKVSLKHGKDKGKIEIEYYGEDELERILMILKQD